MLVISFLLINAYVSAQHALMQSFNINDGLVCNQIRGFCQDRKGFIWIMTWEGLSRYDGNTFRNYTVSEGLAYPLINAMIEGKDERMYISENDGSVDVIINGVVHPELRKSLEQPINKLIRDSDRIFAPSDASGIYVFDEGFIKSLNTSGKNVTVIDMIAVDSLFFVCGSKSGVMRHDHTFINDWPDTLVEYTSIARDNQNRIWVGTIKGLKWVSLSPGAELYDLVPTSFDGTPWAKWIIRDILLTSDGSIWIAAVGGLIQIKEDNSWRLYNRNDGLPAEFVTSVFEDAKGSLWIGTDKGLARLDVKNPIDIFTIAGEMSNNVVRDIVLASDGGAFVLTDKYEVFRIYLNGRIRRIDHGKHGIAYHLLVMGTDTLVSTISGRYKINNGSFELWEEVPFTLAGLSLRLNDSCIFSTRNNHITISSPLETVVDTTLRNIVFALSSCKENEVWVGTLDHGVYRAIVTMNSFGNIEMKLEEFNELLPETTIRSLHADRAGNLWVGTRYSGLVQLRRDPGTGRYVSNIFDRSDGFISSFIKSITTDPQGNVWIGTNAGIEKLIRESTGFRPFSFSRVHNFFGTINKIVVDSNHFVWCTTSSGVARIKDGRYDTIPPSEVFITSVTTANETLLDPQSQLPFKLTYHQNSMGIEFASNDQINGDQLKYSYHLVGSRDTSWSTPQPAHRVSFANLLPGTYRFEVRALGWNGILGNKTSYQFSILPPFWRQGWFMALAVVMISILLYTLYRYRIMQLKQVQNVRDRIASDLHDEIGSSLTHVNILSELGMTKGDEQPQKLFKRIGEVAQASAEAMDDIIWSISSREDTVEDLSSRMRRYASELFDTKGISFNLHEDGLEQNAHIDLEFRRDVYLMYKELLRNIIRHASASEVKVRIQRENQLLWLLVGDDGRGFDPKAPSDRHGLQNIRSRVAKWKGDLTIDSMPGAGTMVRIRLPFRSRVVPRMRKSLK